MAARAPEDLLPTVAVSAVDAAAFPPTAAERAVGVWLPAAWPQQAEVCTLSPSRGGAAAPAGVAVSVTRWRQGGTARAASALEGR